MSSMLYVINYWCKVVMNEVQHTFEEKKITRKNHCFLPDTKAQAYSQTVQLRRVHVSIYQKCKKKNYYAFLFYLPTYWDTLINLKLINYSTYLFCNLMYNADDEKFFVLKNCVMSSGRSFLIITGIILVLKVFCFAPNQKK